MRNRMIKPTFWSDEDLQDVSRDARLLFLGMWNFADDYGVIINSNRQLLGNIFPLDEKVDEKMIEKWKNELIKIGVVLVYKKYLIIPDWDDMQTIYHKSKPLLQENLIEIIAELTDKPIEEIKKENKERKKKNDKKKKTKPTRSEEEKKIIKSVITYLNKKAGTRYRTGSIKNKHITARHHDGVTLEDFKHVVDVKWNEWGKDEHMRKFIRPETLFGTKFDSYLNQYIMENSDSKKKKTMKL